MNEGSLVETGLNRMEESPGGAGSNSTERPG